jgi:hypothetical protein
MNTKDFGKETQLWLDRLACGELGEATRKNLLGWLDAEPLRWRDCALALLEAQAWNESLEDAFPVENGETFGQGIRPGRETRAEKLKPSAEQRPVALRWDSLASLAAAVLIAFTLGALSRGWWGLDSNMVVEKQTQPVNDHSAGTEESRPLMATVALKPELGSDIPATMQIPVRSVGNSEPPQTAAPISEYDRQKWERRGYQLTRERRYLPAQLPNGQKVVVPVEQVKANYVGSKVS